MRRAWGLSRALIAVGSAAAIAALVLAGPTTVAAAEQPALPTLGAIVIPNIGPGYAVTSQGPLNANQFASASPDPSAAAGALQSLARSVVTYERVWQDAGQRNQVQDLVVRCPTDASALAFLRAVRHGLAAGEIVGTARLSQIPGATRTSYFATTSQVGVGQAITVREGTYVVVLSVFSSGTGNPAPITETDAVTITRAQQIAIKKAIHQTVVQQAAISARHRPDHQSPLGWTLLAAAVVILALLVVALRQSRRNRTQS